MANPTDKTISLPFFSPIGGGVWGGAEQKIERKWFWSGGRPRYEGDGAVLSSYALRRAREKAREAFRFLFRIFFKVSSDFVQKVPPILNFCIFG